MGMGVLKTAFVNSHSLNAEGSKTLKLGEWVVYKHPYNGDMLANIQFMAEEFDYMTELDMPYFIDNDGKTQFNGHGFSTFKVRVQITKASNWTGQITGSNSARIRILTEEEEHDLWLYFKGDYPLLINKPLLKEYATNRMKENTHPTLDTHKWVTSFL